MTPRAQKVSKGHFPHSFHLPIGWAHYWWLPQALSYSFIHILCVTEMHVSSCVWREIAIRCAMTLRTNSIWKHVTCSKMLICYVTCTLKHSLGEILLGSVGWRLDGWQGNPLIPTSPWGRLELTSAGGSWWSLNNSQYPSRTLSSGTSSDI